MKLSLDTIGYGGYFTKDYENLSLEDAIQKAADYGYDAACIFAHRPLGFPMDFDADRRKKLVDLYKKLDMEVGAIVCCNNFVDSDHVLVYSTEKEIMYTKQCIDFAVDVGSRIIRVMASLWGYFRNPNADQGYGLPAFETRSRRVSRGEEVASLLARRGALSSASHPLTLRIEPLTERELQVLSLLATGLSNKEIADALVIAVGTAKKHLKNIYDKLDVHSRTQAVARAQDLGIL